MLDLDRQTWGTGPALATARNAAGVAVIDDDLRRTMGQAARRVYEAQYAPAVNHAQLLAIYEQALAA